MNVDTETMWEPVEERESEEEGLLWENRSCLSTHNHTNTVAHTCRLTHTHTHTLTKHNQIEGALSTHWIDHSPKTGPQWLGGTPNLLQMPAIWPNIIVSWWCIHYSWCYHDVRIISCKESHSAMNYLSCSHVLSSFHHLQLASFPGQFFANITAHGRKIRFFAHRYIREKSAWGRGYTCSMEKWWGPSKFYHGVMYTSQTG